MFALLHLKFPRFKGVTPGMSFKHTWAIHTRGRLMPFLLLTGGLLLTYPGLHSDKLSFAQFQKSLVQGYKLWTFESKSECATNELLLLPNFF